MTGKDRWGSIAIFLLMFGIRLGVVLSTGSYQVSDDVESNRAAVSVAERGVLGNIFYADSGPSAHLSPVHPLLLGGIYRVWGSETPAALLVQSLVAIGCVSLMAASFPFLARRAGLPPGAGWLAAALLALLPFQFYVETTGTWEQAEVALALVLLLWMFISIHDRKWADRRTGLLLGLLIGGLALLSPVLLAVAGLLLLAEAVAHRDCRGRVLAHGALSLAVAVVIIAPWAYRNRVALGATVWTRSNFGLEFYVGNNDEASGATPLVGDGNSFLHRHHPFASQEEQSRMRAVGELPYMREKLMLAFDWVQAHPGRFGTLVVKRAQLYWFTGLEQREPKDRWRIPKFLLYVGLGLGAICGLAVLFVQRHPCRWLFLACMLGPGVPYLMTHVSLRYRYPLYPLTLLMTSVALVQAFHVARRRFWSSSASLPSAPPP
ncbi:MAG: hypothetical protein ACKV0T_17970 [Planctomycetales bacterium]